jgi:hypothetical protein
VNAPVAEALLLLKQDGSVRLLLNFELCLDDGIDALLCVREEGDNSDAC